MTECQTSSNVAEVTDADSTAAKSKPSAIILVGSEGSEGVGSNANEFSFGFFDEAEQNDAEAVAYSDGNRTRARRYSRQFLVALTESPLSRKAPSDLPLGIHDVTDIRKLYSAVETYLRDGRLPPLYAFTEMWLPAPKRYAESSSAGAAAAVVSGDGLRRSPLVVGPRPTLDVVDKELFKRTGKASKAVKWQAGAFKGAQLETEVLQRRGNRHILAHEILQILRMCCSELNISFESYVCGGPGLTTTRETNFDPWTVTGSPSRLKSFDDNAKSVLLLGSLRDTRKSSVANNSAACAQEDWKMQEQLIDSRNSDEADVCAVCLGLLKFRSLKRLLCNHEFHEDCIDAWLTVRKVCPLCLSPVLARRLPPGGACQILINQSACIEGFDDAVGSLTVLYEIPGGIQEAHHPNPGQPYSGTNRAAFLPNNQRSHKIAKMLKVAFENGLTFDIGTSRTTAKTNTVIWSGLVPHKSCLTGGPTKFGYPDADYLDEVEASLRRLGILETP